MANEKREDVLKKIRSIITLAKKGLSNTDIKTTLEDLGVDVTQDYVTHTVKAWEETGRNDDPDVVRLKKQERKKGPRSEKRDDPNQIPADYRNDMQWIQVEIMEAKMDRQRIINIMEKILRILDYK